MKNCENFGFHCLIDGTSLIVIIINWFFCYFLLEHWIYSACLLASSWMNLCSKEVQLIVERCSFFSRTFTRNSNSPLEDVSWPRSRDFPPLSRSAKAKLIHSRSICDFSRLEGHRVRPLQTSHMTKFAPKEYPMIFLNLKTLSPMR